MLPANGAADQVRQEPQDILLRRRRKIKGEGTYEDVYLQHEGL